MKWVRGCALVGLCWLSVVSVQAGEREQAGPASAQTATESTPIPVNPHEAVFEVHGIVCSFCARGVEKKLAQLPFVDATKYGDGVLVEIDKQRVTVALKPDQNIDASAAFNAIRAGGYDPVRVHIAAGDGAVRVIEVHDDG